LPTDNLSTGLTANTVRWEATHQDMGNITTTPQIGRLADGSWKVFVGNGFESSSGRAALLVIDVDTGQVESVPVPKVATNLPTAANRQPSAMGGVALAKSANNDTVQAIYAGDTDGRVWRFDVVNSTNGASVVQLGYRNEPLFTATDANTAGKPQPVVAAPLLYTHPQGGHMVLINTGRMSYDSDPTDTQLQSVYGLWDKQAATQDTSTIAAPGIDRSFLAHQRIKSRIDVEQVGAANTTAVSTPATSASDTASTTSSNSSSSETAPPKTRTFFDLSAESISWETQLGWLLDLDVPETTSANSSTIRPKAIYDPQRFSDRLVLFSAVQPGAQIASCVPTSNAMGYGFLVSALTGAQSALPSLDTDGNGTVTGADAIYSSYIYTGGGAQRVLIDEENKRQGSCLNALDSIRCEDPRTKRILDRIWRQLLNPPQPSAGTGSTETTSTVTGKDKTPAGTDTPVTSGTP
jgi:type IV pilus assembly protein PilY1